MPLDLIEHQHALGRAGRKAHPHEHRVVGRGHLDPDASVERHPIVVRARDLVVVREPERPRGRRRRHRAARRWSERRHDLERAALTHPRARQVRRRERLQRRPVVVAVVDMPRVGPAGRCRVRDGDASDEPPGHRHCRRGVAARELGARHRALPRPRPVNGALGLGDGRGDLDRVDPADERRAARPGLPRLGDVQLDALDHAPHGGVEGGPHEVPLVGVQHPALVLGEPVERHAVLVDRAEIAQAGAVVEDEVERHGIGREPVAYVGRVCPLGQHRVAQLVTEGDPAAAECGRDRRRHRTPVLGERIADRRGRREPDPGPRGRGVRGRGTAVVLATPEPRRDAAREPPDPPAHALRRCGHRPPSRASVAGVAGATVAAAVT